MAASKESIVRFSATQCPGGEHHPCSREDANDTDEDECPIWLGHSVPHHSDAHEENEDPEQPVYEKLTTRKDMARMIGAFPIRSSHGHNVSAVHQSEELFRARHRQLKSGRTPIILGDPRASQRAPTPLVFTLEEAKGNEHE